MTEDSKSTVRTILGDSVIGRASLLDSERNPEPGNLFFDNGHLSRKHAEIRWEKEPSEGSACFLIDTGLSLGTTVNGKLLVPGVMYPLQEGDTVGFAVYKPMGVIKTLIYDAQSNLCGCTLVDLDSARTSFQITVEQLHRSDRKVVLSVHSTPLSEPTGCEAADSEVRNSQVRVPEIIDSSDNEETLLEKDGGSSCSEEACSEDCCFEDSISGDESDYCEQTDPSLVSFDSKKCAPAVLFRQKWVDGIEEYTVCDFEAARCGSHDIKETAFSSLEVEGPGEIVYGRQEVIEEDNDERSEESVVVETDDIEVVDFEREESEKSEDGSEESLGRSVENGESEDESQSGSESGSEDGREESEQDCKVAETEITSSSTKKVTFKPSAYACLGGKYVTPKSSSSESCRKRNADDMEESQPQFQPPQKQQKLKARRMLDGVVKNTFRGFFFSAATFLAMAAYGNYLEKEQR